MSQFRLPRHGGILVALAMALCTLLAGALLPAVADTVFPPVTGDFAVKVELNGVTYTYPDGGPGPALPSVENGDQVKIDITDAPGGPDVNFARLRARQCAGDREVSNNTEFNPFVTNRCSSVTLGSGSTGAFVDSGPVAPGTTALSINFTIGTGTAPDIEDPVFGTNLPGFQCGSGHPCKLVVNAEVSSSVGSSNYLGFPINFGAVATVPGAPGTPTATGGNAQATVSWTAPASNGGSPITSYEVTSTPGNKTCTWTTGPLQCTVSTLTNGTAYTFTVRATNGVGQGAASAASNSVTPSAPTVPGAPGTPTATGGNAQATVSWTAPASNGGSPITSYEVTSTPGNKTCTWTTGPLQCTVSTLTNGTAYTFTVRATNGVGQGAASAASNSVTPSVPTGDLFTGIAPKRVLDSRPAFQVGPFSTPWGAATTRDVTVAGGTTTVPADADAVTLNVTVTQTTAVSYLSIWPKGEAQPTVSSLNWDAGWTVPNAVTVKVGAGGQISIYNNLGIANVIVDVVGYYKEGSGAGFTSLQPKRLLDSRPSFQVGPYNTPWGAGTTREVTVAGGTTTVPADADAVVLNVTVTQTNAVSYLSVWPSGQAQPTVSSLNWDSGWTIPNAVTVKVGSGGRIQLYNNQGTANVIVDVVGYFKAGTGSVYHPLSPARLLDSRPGFQVGPFNTPWVAATTRNLDVTSNGVPDSADSVLLNVTVTQTNAVSYLSVWPSGQAQPTVSSLNWVAGWTIPNAVTAKVGTSGQIKIFNNLGSAHVLADVAGWYG